MTHVATVEGDQVQVVSRRGGQLQVYPGGDGVWNGKMTRERRGSAPLERTTRTRIEILSEIKIEFLDASTGGVVVVLEVESYPLSGPNGTESIYVLLPAHVTFSEVVTEHGGLC